MKLKLRIFLVFIVGLVSAQSVATSNCWIFLGSSTLPLNLTLTGLENRDQTWVVAELSRHLQRAQELELASLPIDAHDLPFELKFGKGDFAGGGLSRQNGMMSISDATLQTRDTTIVAHELGHSITGVMYSNVVSEGFADVVSNLLTGVTEIGTVDYHRTFIRNNINKLSKNEISGSANKPMREIVDSPNDLGRAAEFARNARTMVDMPGTNVLGGVDSHVPSLLISRFLFDIRNDQRSKTTFNQRFAQLYRSLSFSFKRSEREVLAMTESLSELIREEIIRKYPSSSGVYREDRYAPIVDFHIVAAFMYALSPDTQRPVVREKFLNRGGDAAVFDRLTGMIRVTRARIEP